MSENAPANPAVLRGTTISTRKACQMSGLGPRELRRAVEAAGLRIIQFKGIPPKFIAEEIARMTAEARGEAVA